MFCGWVKTKHIDVVIIKDHENVNLPYPRLLEGKLETNGYTGSDLVRHAYVSLFS